MINWWSVAAFYILVIAALIHLKRPSVKAYKNIKDTIQMHWSIRRWKKFRGALHGS